MTPEIATLYRSRFSTSRSGGSVNWPALDLVSVDVITDPIKLFDLGKRCSGAQGDYVDVGGAPHELRRALEQAGYPWIEGNTRWPLRAEFLGYDHFGNAGVRDPERANIGVVFEPHEDRSLVLAVVGCDHTWTNTQLGRCWMRVTCTRCGYTYEVDSSD